MPNMSYNLEIAPKPMNENMFDYLVKGILPTLEDKEYQHLCISYEPVREDEVGCVQAVKNGENFHVEIIEYRDDGEPYHIFARDDVTLDDTVIIFKEILVHFNPVDLEHWDEISEDVKFYQHTRKFHHEQSFEDYKKDISLYLQRKWDFTAFDAEKRVSDYEDYTYGSYMYQEPVSSVAPDLEDIVQHPDLYCPNEKQELTEKKRQRLLLIEKLRTEYLSLTPDQQDLIDAFADYLMEPTIIAEEWTPDTKRELRELLMHVPDYYADFEHGVMILLKTEEQRQKMIRCLKANPELKTDTILEHMHEFNPSFPHPCVPIEPLKF